MPSVTTVNPANGNAISKYELQPFTQISERISLGHKAHLEWRVLGFSERAMMLKKVSLVLQQKKESLSRLMSLEMGKPISQAYLEIEKCAWVCDHYAENAEEYLTAEIVTEPNLNAEVVCQPLGVVFAVMPWNFPFWQVFRFAAPALMAGNVGLLKHSSNTTGCALEIEKVFLTAGLPEGIFQTVVCDHQVTEQIIAHPLVRAVTLTGSSEAGQKIAAIAGKYLKKSVLELGGSDPYIVLKDANIDDAVKACVKSRLINTGQSCIAAKRFIVEAPIYEKFTKEVVEEMSRKKVGAPLDDLDLGPMARVDLRDELHKQVIRSVQEGAKLLLGGTLPEMPGAYYMPTVLSDVLPEHTCFREELFGPVAAIVRAQDASHAVELANTSEFGLGAAVFTESRTAAHKIALKIDSGCVFINDFVKSDPRLPFGGIKSSGYGRELSHYGIKEFCNIKTIAG
ncbi:MAG: succinate-semialdehyde dehydrogenase [Bdellovibrionales bacterium CG10_big_fil_rev_8_21_14_0_10_45_34]|nr:MAG: succinate-semialdehyde dehydrogenase [Bdellovibrionales bacterium CG10_big_fil_rev_8_21_14_0_10_45_34]